MGDAQFTSWPVVTLGHVLVDVSAARDLAERLLSADLPRRWSHVVAVAERAREVSRIEGVDEALLEAAAWLHDIGYAPGAIDTGFHPLDGARYLRHLGFCPRVVSLVAHHTFAQEEADARGLGPELAQEFQREESKTTDALWFCDMTTGPDGQRMTAEERLNEICTRYGPGDPVTRFVDRARDDLIAAVKRTEAELGRADGGT